MTPRKKATKKAREPKAPPKLHGVPHNPDVEAKPLTTKADLEAHIRSLGLRCQGPRDEAKMAEWQRLMDAGDLEGARLVRTRTGCGQDFSETVLSEPFDGKEHETICKKCGTVNSWRSPVFDGLSEPKKGKRAPSTGDQSHA